MLTKLESIMATTYYASRLQGATRQECTQQLDSIKKQEHLVTEDDGVRTAWDNEPSLEEVLNSIEATVSQSPLYDKASDRLQANTSPRRYI